MPSWISRVSLKLALVVGWLTLQRADFYSLLRIFQRFLITFGILTGIYPAEFCSVANAAKPLIRPIRRRAGLPLR
jgi:hypothetical protein